MTQSPRATVVGTEFDEFLYASIVEEGDAGQLTVLSALARLNMDPWDEAARLARLPREAAMQTLDALIAALPNGPSARPDSGALAARLVALLPGRTATSSRSTNRAPGPGIRIDFHAMIGYYLIGIVLYLGIIWFMRPPPEASGPTSAASPAASATLSRADAQPGAPAAGAKHD